MRWGGAGRRPVLREPHLSPAAHFQPAPGSGFPPPACLLTYTLFGFGTGPCTPSLGPCTLIPGLARVPASRRPGGGRGWGWVLASGSPFPASPLSQEAYYVFLWPSVGTWVVYHLEHRTPRAPGITQWDDFHIHVCRLFPVSGTLFRLLAMLPWAGCARNQLYTT